MEGIWRAQAHSGDSGGLALWSSLGYHYGLNNSNLRKYIIRERELNLFSLSSNSKQLHG